MNRTGQIIVALLAVGLILALHTSASACPLCKETVSSDKNDDGPGGAGVGGFGGEGGGGLPGGFNTSVYLLLGAFFVVLGGLIAGVFRAIKSTPMVMPAMPVMPPQNSPAFAGLPSGSSQGGTGSQRD